MGRLSWLSIFPPLLLTVMVPITVLADDTSDRDRLAQAVPTPSGCPAPALSRLVRHKVAANETLESIARKYDLIPATLMGLNPALRSGKAPVGSEILIPPYNGIRVELGTNQSWRDIARKYGVRPDVLFEVNGCQPAPKVVFVPGVNWSPVATSTATNAKPQSRQILSGYPFASKPSQSVLLLGYGWGIQPLTGTVGFHGGVDLAAPVGTPVLAIADGTVAFAGNQGAFGNLIVLNHREGLQTRYANLGRLQVKVGQTVRRGQAIATVGVSGRPSSKQPHLHFEVRSRSNLGWVAENPEIYLPFSPAKPSQAKR